MKKPPEDETAFCFRFRLALKEVQGHGDFHARGEVFSATAVFSPSSDLVIFNYSFSFVLES